MNIIQATIKKLVLIIRYTYLKKRDENKLIKNKWLLLAEKVKLVDSHMFVSNLSKIDLSRTLSSACSDVGIFKNNLININQAIKGNYNVKNYIKTIGSTVSVRDYFTRDTGHYLTTPHEYINDTMQLLTSIANYCATETTDSDGVTMNNKYMLEFYYQHLLEYVELLLEVCLA